jgi:UDP-N-acetylmuramoyl-tripeptide--D-alanyl-D-alanine ligase
MPDDIEYAIFEVGMNHSGEIRAMMPYIKPNITLINNILPSHIGNFSSLKGIADAKLEIIEGLDVNGIAIFNRDSEFYDYCLEKAKKLSIKNTYSFGENIESHSRLAEYNFHDNMGSHTINIDNRNIIFNTKIGGKHRILNTLCNNAYL